MLRILVFNGTPADVEGRFVRAGSKSYDQLIRESLDLDLPIGVVADYFTLWVADGEHLPQGISIADFDGVWISGRRSTLTNSTNGLCATRSNSRERFEINVFRPSAHVGAYRS